MSQPFSRLMIDIKYANLLSNQLQLFKVKNNNPYVAQFRCCLCGDSKKNTTKARGYFVKHLEDNQLIFKCFNGCQPSAFWNFLEKVNPALHKDYVRELFLESGKKKYGEKKHGKSNGYKDKSEDIPSELPKWNKSVFSSSTSIRDLKETHPAKQYVQNRRIPEKYWKDLYYVKAFGDFTNQLIPGKIDISYGDEPRLIIPFFNSKRECFGYQGRSFDKNASLRYITIMLDPFERKAFGFERLNFNKRIYVCEGPIDSLFIDNAIATVQGDLTSVDSMLMGKRITYIPDKDIRNPEIIKSIEKLIRLNKEVCLLPHNLDAKDINEIVLKYDYSEQELKQLIDDHTYSGPRLKLEFSKWKKT